MKTLFVLVLVTVLGPLLAARLRIPAAAVLILSGIGVGPLGLKWVGDTRTVSFTAELGFLILMFLAGMEIDFEQLRVAGRRAILPPLLTAVATWVLAVAVGLALRLSMAEVLVISAMSLGMPLAVLIETDTLRSPVGRQVLLTASIGEFGSILALTAWQITSRTGGGMHLLREFSTVAAVIAVSLVAIRWARAFVWWFPKLFERAATDHETAEIGVRFGLLLMLGFVAFVAAFDIEAILGAFIAGTLLSFVLREKHSLEKKLAALGHGLFIPIFFVVIGVRFEPRALDRGALLEALALVVVAGVVKILPAVAFAPRGLRFRERVGVGTLLAAPLTLVVAIGAVGQQLGVVSNAKSASFVVVAMALSIVFPAVYRVLQGRVPHDTPGRA